MGISIKSRFGKRIRRLRKDRGWSQEEHGEKCNLDRTYISGIERGVRNPSLEALESLAVGFGLSLAELMGDL